MAKMHQFNVRFDAEQDRIVWSISTDDGSEIRLLITRRFLSLLLQVMDRLAENSPEIVTHERPETRQAIKSFQKEQAIEQTDFTTEYAPQVTSRPLGEEALLAKQVNFKTLADGTHQVGIGVVDGRMVNLVLDQNLLLAVIKLFDDGAERAQWGIRSGEVPRFEVPGTEDAGNDASIH